MSFSRAWTLLSILEGREPNSYVSGKVAVFANEFYLTNETSAHLLELVRRLDIVHKSGDSTTKLNRGILICLGMSFTAASFLLMSAHPGAELALSEGYLWYLILRSCTAGNYMVQHCSTPSAAADPNTQERNMRRYELASSRFDSIL